MLANLLIGASEPEVNFDSVTITLNNPNTYGTGTNDYFGYAVAISENYAVVAAQDSDASGTYSGKVYVYDVTNGTLLRTFVNPNPYGASDNDFFGRSVAIYGDLVVVGAYNEDEASNDNSGKVYIYSISNNALIYTINNPNAFGTAANDMFGIHVAIFGNLMIVGAYQEDSTSTYTNAGKAYIFNAASGTLLFTLNDTNAYGTPKDDYFGWSVDIDENYAIVGAYGEDESTRFTTSGKAYVFDVSTGLLVSTLNNPNAYSTPKDDYFGFTVAISGNYAAVGAYQEDDASGASSGKVYIFDVITGSLIRTFNNPNPYGTSANDFFGYHVNLHGKYLITGAHQEDEAGNTNSGKAYVFDITTGNLVKTFNNPNAYNTSANDFFRFNVAIYGRRAIVGVHQEDDASGTSSGKAYIFY